MDSFKINMVKHSNTLKKALEKPRTKSMKSTIQRKTDLT